MVIKPYLGNACPKHIWSARHALRPNGMLLLCECLALPLQKAVARFCPLELRLHEAQRLPGWEDGLAILILRSAYGTARWRIPAKVLRTAAPDMAAVV